MLVDEVNIILEGGHGGRGIVSFGAKLKSGPDGGNGGRGGDLYVKAVSDVTLLHQYTQKSDYKAEDGMPGYKNKKTGRNGHDLEVLVPVGTTLKDIDTGEEIAFLKANEQVLVAKGGLGGRGNFEFRSPRRTTPMFAQGGLPGDKREFKAILKLIADFGLVGLPNAGKSSILNELTAAKAKTASYAFTTLSPNLGVIDGRIIADIPGLIEGASEGKGLGHKFLKHIEKVKLLLHCISSESTDVVKDYEIVKDEMANYNKKLLRKKEYILLTKTDLVSEKQTQKNIKNLKILCEVVIPVSIHDWDSIESLKKLI